MNEAAATGTQTHSQTCSQHEKMLRGERDLVDLCERILNQEQAVVKLLAHIEQMNQIVSLLPLFLAKHLIFENLGHFPSGNTWYRLI